MRHLQTRFGNKTVHEDINLTVYEGDIYGILGGSGSGKTTLLREMIMLLRPSGGSIEVLGYDLNRIGRKDAQRLRSEWGVLFQFGALFTSLTVEENVAVWLKEYTSLSDTTIRRIVRSKLEMVGLDPDVGRLYPSELSGGMVKRSALALSGRAHFGSRSGKRGGFRRSDHSAALSSGPDNSDDNARYRYNIQCRKQNGGSWRSACGRGGLFERGAKKRSPIY